MLLELLYISNQTVWRRQAEGGFNAADQLGAKSSLPYTDKHPLSGLLMVDSHTYSIHRRLMNLKSQCYVQTYQ